MNDRATNTPHDGEEPQAPAKLVAALKEPSPRRVFVPPTVDELVLATARRQLMKPAKFSLRSFRSWFFWPAVATACLVLAGIGYFFAQPTPARFAREDINRDGRVDILDAFALARELKAAVPPSPAADLNNDGVVDRHDAEWIAAQAVKLEKDGRS